MMKATLSLCLLLGSCNGFTLSPLPLRKSALHASNENCNKNVEVDSQIQPLESINRRQLMKQVGVILPSISCFSQISNAGSFTPGGTLVDREVGVTIGNREASPNRKVDNSNVLFSQDHYFKFGAAAPWIEPDSVEFPKSMPFVLSQQRYDALKKYGQRVIDGTTTLNNLRDTIKDGNRATIVGASDPIYALRPLGLLANGFLGSENTGTTNELLLARWYINEMYLRVGDIRNATTDKEAQDAHEALQKSINSYYAMMNRVITSKVGNKFEYIG